MGHHASYIERIEYIDGKIVRIIKATYKNFSEDVYKEELETNKHFCRYLYFSHLAGYLVVFPGEKLGYYYGYEVQKEEDFGECSPISLCNGYVTENEKQLIINYHPELKYLINKIKYNITGETLFKVIRLYKEHPECETLIQINQIKLANNKNLYKLKKPKLKQVINFVKQNSEIENMTLQNILSAIKHNLNYKDYSKYLDIKYFFSSENDKDDIFKYLVNKNYDPRYYYDYLCMAKQCGHNVRDQYWRFPNDLYKMHDKVMFELSNIEESKNNIWVKMFENISKKIGKNSLKIVNGYTMYIPNDWEDMNNHAKALSQCLVNNGYFKKMARQKSCLIFIKKDNISIGTVEIDFNKKILQQYGDEKNHSDINSCFLNDEVQEAVNIYLKKLKIKKFKASSILNEKNIFIKGLYENDSSFNGMQFIEGKTYCTKSTDEEVIKYASKCLATNKVFHFCKSIQDIQLWVTNPSKYAIVKAIGAISQNGTAYMTNKMKVLKIANLEDIISYIANDDEVCNEIGYGFC